MGVWTESLFVAETPDRSAQGAGGCRGESGYTEGRKEGSMVKRVGDTWIRADTSRVNPPSREGREGKREGGGTSTKALCRCCEHANCFSFS